MSSATERIADEAERATSTIARIDPATRVPSCPDWNAADLLWHITEVHEFWARILETGALDDAEIEAIEAAKAPRPEGENAVAELLERRRAATTGLIAQLEQRGDDEAAWSWFAADQTVGFTRRMQVHEATMHRVDAELAAGVTPISPIEEAVAIDGVDHVANVMLAGSADWIPDWATVDAVAALRVEPDGGAQIDMTISHWSGARPRDGKEFSQLVVTPGSGVGGDDALPGVTASGSARALYLWLWGRGNALDAADAVDVRGDQAAVDHLTALLAQGID